MKQVKKLPSVEACTRLLRAWPAVGAFKRTLRDVVSSDAFGWIGALSVIARHDDGIRPSHLADMLHVDLSVVSRSVTQLEELGYVTRERDPEDGRAFVVHVAPAGRERIEQLTTGFAEHISSRLDGWSDVDVDSFTTALRRFGSTLEHAQDIDTVKGTA
jgi:DNA-binding MarR family transcriptional regulator